MKKLFKAIILSFLPLSLFSLSPASVTQRNFCGTQNNAFRAGETVKMKVFYNSLGAYIGAGEATFSTRLERHTNGRPVYHFLGTGKTYSFFDAFFKVRDRYESWVDTTSLLPYRFIRNIEEGSYKKVVNVNFDHRAKVANSTAGVFTINECMQDVVSAVYYARNIDYSTLKPGDRVFFDMFLDDEIYHLYIRYMGRETVKTQYGKFRAIRIKPLLVKGTIFEGGENMNAWLSDDPNRLLLRVESPIAVGNIKVDMMGYSGLRYPLTSLRSLR